MLICDIKDQDFIIDESYLPIGTGEKSAVDYLQSMCFININVKSNQHRSAIGATMGGFPCEQRFS